MTDDYTTNSHCLTYTFLFKSWGSVLFELGGEGSIIGLTSVNTPHPSIGFGFFSYEGPHKNTSHKLQLERSSYTEHITLGPELLLVLERLPRKCLLFSYRKALENKFGWDQICCLSKEGVHQTKLATWRELSA